MNVSINAPNFDSNDLLTKIIIILLIAAFAYSCQRPEPPSPLSKTRLGDSAIANDKPWDEYHLRLK